MYRSVTQSKLPRDERRKTLYRLEGVLVGLAVFLAVFYAIGWLKL
ncbi:MAG: hypothetical protein ACE5GS_10190 [Kiloniellaceae bacterium]